MTNYLRNLIAIFMLVAMTLSGAAWAKKDPVYTSYFGNVGAGGYDVTAYFTEGRPVEGKGSFKTEYQGAEWYFASKSNRDLFIADPEHYAPQYGGYCAWAVSQNQTASGDPLLWTVHDDKLYLNYNKEINNRWAKDKVRLIALGDKYWPEVLK